MQRRKGQWFIVGAFLIITLLSAAIFGRSQVQIGGEIEPWQKYIFRNIKADSENALTSILSENRTSENIEARLKDYSDFIRTFGDSRAINLTLYFIVGLPTADGLNITVVNFEKNRMSPVSITVNGTTQTIAEIPDGSASTVAFSPLPDYIVINYTITEINSAGAPETESDAFNTTQKVFSALKLRISTKDGNQVWQDIRWI